MSVWQGWVHRLAPEAPPKWIIPLGLSIFCGVHAWVSIHALSSTIKWTCIKSSEVWNWINNKHFILHVLRAFVLRWFKIILEIISIKSIWPADDHLAGTTTLDKRGSGSNVNQSVTKHSPELLNFLLITRCNLVSYPGQDLLNLFAFIGRIIYIYI